MGKDFEVVDLNYVSLYIHDYEDAIKFYTEVFGAPDTAIHDADMGAIHGWRMGATWLTLFPSEQGSAPESKPRNSEFAIQVAKPQQVDALYAALVAAGANAGWEPRDTEMYDPMRFSYADDPFGTRIDIICLLLKEESET